MAIYLKYDSKDESQVPVTVPKSLRKVWRALVKFNTK